MPQRFQGENSRAEEVPSPTPPGVADGPACRKGFRAGTIGQKRFPPPPPSPGGAEGPANIPPSQKTLRAREWPSSIVQGWQVCFLAHSVHVYPPPPPPPVSLLLTLL